MGLPIDKILNDISVRSLDPTKKFTPRKCGYCDFFSTERKPLDDHLVEKHGFTRLGDSVYFKRTCYLCKSPGIYRVGAKTVCSKHKVVAQSMLKAIVERRDEFYGDKEKAEIAAERNLVSSINLKQNRKKRR